MLLVGDLRARLLPAVLLYNAALPTCLPSEVRVVGAPVDINPS